VPAKPGDSACGREAGNRTNSVAGSRFASLR
jgi:hypothetical protein